MNTLDALLSTPLAYHLGWTLVDFLWQGILVGAAYACLRVLLRDASPQQRYWLSLGALAVLALLPVVTFIHLLGATITVPSIVGVAQSAPNLMAAPSTSPLDALRELLHPIVPWTVPAWCAGVALMAFRSFSGWRKTHELLRDGTTEAPGPLQETLARLATEVGVRVRVQLLLTAKVVVPCVAGLIKPVILLPPAALTNLTPLQLEMVLAHELSHIRRHDYLVNLLQIGVETLLFYHPVVRWISRDARRERELCCDDCAIHACGDDALHYAHALTDLAGMQAVETSMAMALNGGELTMRVERLIAPHHGPQGAPRLPTVMLASVVFFGGVLLLASARQMPLSLAKLNSFSMLGASALHDSIATMEARLAPVLTPTHAAAALPNGGKLTAMKSTLLSASLPLPEVLDSSAPDLAAAPALAPVPVIPERKAMTVITLDHPNPADGASSLARQATGPIEIIQGNHMLDSTPPNPQHHEYCTPLTGSRVCR